MSGMDDADQDRPPSEAEIREEIEYWVISRSANSREVVHIPADDSTSVDPKPVCELTALSSAQPSQYHGWISKPIEVYPPGYMRICRSCLSKLK
jgi:hypothetical protein